MFRTILILTAFLTTQLGIARAQESCTRVLLEPATSTSLNLDTTQTLPQLSTDPGENMTYSYPVLITSNSETRPTHVQRIIIMNVDEDGRIIITPMLIDSIPEALWPISEILEDIENEATTPLDNIEEAKTEI